MPTRNDGADLDLSTDEAIANYMEKVSEQYDEYVSVSGIYDASTLFDENPYPSQIHDVSAPVSLHSDLPE